MTDKETEITRLYVCSHCGTVSSTNSKKHFAREQPTDEEFENWEVGEEGTYNYETAVRMTPPCPCGNDIFTPIEVCAVHYTDVDTPHARQ